MLTKLRLENFKSFKEAELALGPLTLLVGANASGKSNLRDAFRFLHGIARGYSLADIMGGKFGEGGERQWTGIRGGPREMAFQGAPTFALEISFTLVDESEEREASYRIEVEPGGNGKVPRIVAERLVVSGYGDFIFETSHNILNRDVSSVKFLYKNSSRDITLPSQQPILSQFVEKPLAAHRALKLARSAIDVLSSMRFLDLNSDSMRLPSFPGQTVLGDHGENLSSVLQNICADPQQKHALIQRIQKLTPMDAVDFDFPADPIGRVIVTLVEENGQRTTAYSASDGTLRFLAMIAALLGPEPARFYFFEELDNGIHPTRLHLLLQLIERQVFLDDIQMVATTHSPQLLRLVSPSTLEHTSFTYRLQGEPDTHIKRILDIPEARRIIEEQDIALLHESGWLEDAVEFLATEEAA